VHVKEETRHLERERHLHRHCQAVLLAALAEDPAVVIEGAVVQLYDATNVTNELGESRAAEEAAAARIYTATSSGNAAL
jgi:cyanophycinase-like exopeptidase